MMDLYATVSSILAEFGTRVVFHARTEAGDTIRMVADKDEQIQVGEVRTFSGEWQYYNRSGKQFAVQESRISRLTNSMVEMFLVSQTGIGKATAGKLVKHFGAALPNLLDQKDFEAISSVRGVGEVTAHLAIHGWHEQGVKSELVEFISKSLQLNHDKIRSITVAVLKAHQFYRDDALSKLKANPYLLWSFCTWDLTDRLALALGIASDDRRRLLCATEESLYRLYSDGHTAPSPLAVADTLESLLNTKLLTCIAIYEAARDDGFLTERFFKRNDGGWSLPASFIMESYVQTELLRRAEARTNSLANIFDVSDVSGFLLPGSHRLDKEQEEAVNSILNNGVVVVIGAAGTGKTSVLHAANHFLHKSGNHVLQVALSGKAAQRLIEQTGQDAFTIESLLIKLASTPDLLDRFDLPVIFIDEASMIDLPLMYRILKAFEGKQLKLVAIGDRGQLPPIGPGLVFHKMVETNSFPVIELKTNYRALAGSTIPEVANNVRSGGLFRTSADVVMRNVVEGIAEEAIEQYLQHTHIGSVQIIAATKRVMAQANRRLQARLLKSAPCVQSAPEFRIGDKVIYKRNDPAIGIVNGSIGTVVQIHGDEVLTNGASDEPVPADIVINFIREGRIPLLLPQIKNGREGEWYLQHAYAITGHQAQGSEFDCVIVALEQSRLLDRSWLYTAITRAREKVILVGDEELVQRAIDAGNLADRRSVGLEFELNSNGD